MNIAKLMLFLLAFLMIGNCLCVVFIPYKDSEFQNKFFQYFIPVLENQEKRLFINGFVVSASIWSILFVFLV